MKYIPFIILLFFFGIQQTVIFSQDIPDKKKTANQKNQTQTSAVKTSADSLKKSDPFAKKDTIETQKVNSQVFWYDSENKIRSRKEEVDEYLFGFRQEKQTIYRNLSDVFRQQPLWYGYDLKESGRPLYIAQVNSYPHQSSFFYNGVLMNDPIHGMFNSQYIPLNFVRYVQHSTAGQNIPNFGLGGVSAIHVVSSSRHTRAPWSKIVYKQGNYGYSDLDISFVHPATPDIAVQLGGLNRVFDGNFNISERHGTNYRGELTWQLKNNMYLRGQLFLNRERVGLSAITDQISNLIVPVQVDLRDDYFIGFTWLPTDTITQSVNVKLYNTYSIRRLKDKRIASYHNKYQFKRYGMDANYNFNIGGFDFLAGGGMVWNKIWGTVFNKQYFPVYYNAYGKINIPITEELILKPQAQIMFDEEIDPQLSLSVGAENSFSTSTKIIAGITRTGRYPNATEKYADILSYHGNESLSKEDHLAGNVKLDTKLFSNLSVELTTQYNQIKNEIVLVDSIFTNGSNRDFLVLAGKLNFNFWKLDLQAGGFETISDIHLTAQRSGWFKIHFGDIWLNGALGIDAYATIQYWGKHVELNYEPILERFYRSSGIEDDYTLFNWKIVATVQDARIFFEMDNSLSEVYEIINHYQEYSQRWRFGVHWILWD